MSEGGGEALASSILQREYFYCPMSVKAFCGFLPEASVTVGYAMMEVHYYYENPDWRLPKFEKVILQKQAYISNSLSVCQSHYDAFYW